MHLSCYMNINFTLTRPLSTHLCPDVTYMSKAFFTIETNQNKQTDPLKVSYRNKTKGQSFINNI